MSLFEKKQRLKKIVYDCYVCSKTIKALYRFFYKLFNTHSIISSYCTLITLKATVQEFNFSSLQVFWVRKKFNVTRLQHHIELKRWGQTVWNCFWFENNLTYDVSSKFINFMNKYSVFLTHWKSLESCKFLQMWPVRVDLYTNVCIHSLKHMLATKKRLCLSLSVFVVVQSWLVRKCKPEL